MKPKVILKHIAVTFLLIFMGRSFYAQKKYVNADSICKIALSMPVDEGIRFLTQNAQKCNDAANSEDCHFMIFFTAGYLSQVNIERSGDPQKYTEYALQFYHEALRSNPENIQVLTNMYILYRNRAYEEALKTLDKLAEIDNENASKYYLNKAGIYAEKGDHAAEAMSYRQAFWADPNETACWNAFNAYNNIKTPGASFNGIMSFSKELADQKQYDYARNGYLFAIKKAIHVNDQGMANMACLKWLETVSLDPKHINTSMVNELPDTIKWRSECNVELHRLFADPLRFFLSNKNLNLSLKERHIMASVLLGFENEAIMKGNIKYAVQLLDIAFSMAPEFFQYHSEEMKDLSPIKMNIALELARVYTNYPEFDSDGSRFNTLIQRLFNEKAVHYQQKDLEAIQRSHTVLGLIYAERNVWRSDWYAGNAIYQLEHAIKIQKNLEKQDPSKYRPIPSLYQTLANGYAFTGQKEQEATAFLNASIGYLDIDYIDESAKFVRKAGSMNSLPQDKVSLLRTINSIINLRSDINHNRINFKEDPATLEKQITQNYVFTSVSPDYDSFLNRQRFKILSDIGQKVSGANPNYSYPVFEIKALEYLKKEKTLSSPKDIQRINHIEKTFRTNLQGSNIISVKPGANTINRAGNTKDLHLNTGESTTMVEINNDLFLIGKLYETISQQNNTNVKELKQIRIRQGYVTIPEAEKETEAEPIDRKMIQNTEGVKRIKVIPR